MAPLLRLIESYDKKNRPTAVYIEEFIERFPTMLAIMTLKRNELVARELSERGQIDKAILAMQVSVDYNYKIGQLEKAQQQAFYISRLRNGLNHKTPQRNRMC